MASALAHVETAGGQSLRERNHDGSAKPNLCSRTEPHVVRAGAQKEVRVRIARMTNLLGEAVRVSITARTIESVPRGQPPSGFFWGPLETEIPVSGSRDFAIEFMPRAEPVFKDAIEVRIEPKGIVEGNVVEIELVGKGLPIEVQPF